MKTLTYWERLSSESRPILLYGTGNGADKILDACEKYNIRVSGVFASNGFVRSRTFRDMPVLSHDAVVEQYGEDIIVLPAFGTTLPEVMDFFHELDRRHTVIIPEVPLYGGGIFDADYLLGRREELENVYNMLSDELSRKLFYNAVMFRITGEMKYLEPCETMRESMGSLFGELDIHTAIDGGAFKGDSALDMIEAIPSLDKIYACEPDPSTFKKLSAFAESESGAGKVIPVECALSNTECYVESSASGSRGSGVEGRNKRAKTKTVHLNTIDNIVGDEHIDYVKLDVEGSEREAILGAENTLRASRPIMSVSLYHRTGDLIDLPVMIAERLGECKMYLRRPKCIPMWDLNLYVIPCGK